MKCSEISKRYATALFNLAGETGTQEIVFGQLRQLGKVFQGDDSIANFIQSPLFQAIEKEEAVRAAIKGSGLDPILESFLLLLAKNGRIQLLSEITEAYQGQIDEENGVSRGRVRSMSTLSSEERVLIQEKVEKASGKKVVLTYKEDANLIGGLVAEVGSYTFDDTLRSHLHRLKDELLKRSSH